MVSFVRRSARMNPSQQRSWDAYRDRYLVEILRNDASTSVASQPIPDWTHIFGRTAPLVVEIGSGRGDALAAAAQANPGCDFVGFEVFEPALASTIGRLTAHGSTNARLVLADGVQGLATLFAPGSLAEIRVFFPDPWHKARHHKRRLVTPEFAALAADRLAEGAVLRLATDWQDYAEAMREVLDDSTLVGENPDDGWSPRFDERPVTKYEHRGLEAGRTIHDLTYRKHDDRR